MNLNGDFKKYMQALGDISDPRPLAPVHDHLHDHPSENAWLEFTQNRLGAADRKTLEHHLARCLSCSTTLTDLRDFFDPIRPDETEFSEFEALQRWRALRERLEFEPEETLWSRWKTRLTISRPLLALAAGLLITTTALGLIAYQLWQEKRALQSFIDQHHNQAAAKIGQTPKEKDLQQALNEKQALIEKLNATESRLEALDQPQINTPISEIIVDDTIHSNFSTNGKTELSTTLPPQSNFFALTLKIVSDAFPTYKIEFIDQNNRVVLDKSSLKPDARANQSGGPRPNEQATITISIPRSSFPAGQYTFRVSGQDDQRTTLLESLRWTFK